MICFTTDGDIWGVGNDLQLTTCGPETLRDQTQVGMDVVDASMNCWRVSSLRAVGRAPFFKTFRLFRPRFWQIEHEFEAPRSLTLAELQERMREALEIIPEYWCDDPTSTEEMQVLQTKVRQASSVTELHGLLGLDYFAY